MADFTIHGVPGSPYVRSALLGLEEKGAAYRFAAMQMGDNKKPEHRALHPFGRVPRRKRSCAISTTSSPPLPCSRRTRKRGPA
jgi:hypothetical protein